MYATIQQLEDRLTASLLNQRIPEIGQDRERVLTAYLTDASAIVDAYICNRYAVPAPSSSVLAHICLSIAIWQIEADRGGGVAADRLPPGIQIPYDKAMEMLKGISSGDISLSGTDAPETSSAYSAGLTVSSPASRFSPDSPGMAFF